MQRLIVFLLFTVTVSLIAASVAATAQGDDLLKEGRAKAADGDIAGAMAIYETLTREQPESADAFAHLGGMQLLDQRYSDAVRSFQTAISLGDASSRSFIGMGMAYLHMGQLGPARAAFVEAQNLGSDRPEEISDIIAWIDSRANQPRTGH